MKEPSGLLWTINQTARKLRVNLRLPSPLRSAQQNPALFLRQTPPRLFINSLASLLSRSGVLQLKSAHSTISRGSLRAHSSHLRPLGEVHLRLRSCTTALISTCHIWDCAQIYRKPNVSPIPVEMCSPLDHCRINPRGRSSWRLPTCPTE